MLPNKTIFHDHNFIQHIFKNFILPYTKLQLLCINIMMITINKDANTMNPDNDFK